MIDNTSELANNKNHAWLKNFCLNHGLTIEETLQLDDKNLLEAWGTAAQLLGLKSDELARALSKEFSLSVVSAPSHIDPELFQYVPFKIAKRYNIFPIKKTDDRIIVASANPADNEMLSMLSFLSALHIETAIAPPEIIRNWIEKHYEKETDTHQEVTIQKSTSTSRFNKTDQVSEDSAIVEIVSDMLLEAFELNASDIHIEPFKDGGIIRYRVDGMLKVITELPLMVFRPILQRIKAISGLNLANKLIPQDGSVGLLVRGQPVDLRVSTIPVKGGEKAVIRLLIQSSVGTIDEIGLGEQELQRFKNLLEHSSGIFVITGPTGSGKSTTLYSALKALNTPERCLVTVEDPIEYKIDGIAQIKVNPAQNVTFNAALRHILRQDPDVILVGEVRDEETADITLRAAITGHFVMTTLHTNDAITTIPRLRGLGVSETILADSLKGVAAQRLVRKLCSHCASNKVDEQNYYVNRFLKLFPGSAIKAAMGCDKCMDSGYKGRMPIFEIITINNELSDAIRAHKSTTQLREIAWKNGNRPISIIAKDAILKGNTSVEEIHRVLGEQFWTDLEAAK